MHEYFPKHLSMGISRMNQDIVTARERMWEEKSEYGKKHSGQEKKRCPNDLSVARAYRPPGVATPRISAWIT